MSKPVTFRQFIGRQISRLHSFPRFSLDVDEAGECEIANWLEETSGGKPYETQPSDLAWLQECLAARRVKAAIDEALTLESSPGLPTLRSIWQRLHGEEQGSAKRANPECPKCHGSGWRIVVSASGSEGAARCCGMAPPGTPQASIPASAMQDWREQERREAGKRRNAPPVVRGLQRAVPRPLPPLRNPITEADFAATKGVRS